MESVHLLRVYRIVNVHFLRVMSKESRQRVLREVSKQNIEKSHSSQVTIVVYGLSVFKTCIFCIRNETSLREDGNGI